MAHVLGPIYTKHKCRIGSAEHYFDQSSTTMEDKGPCWEYIGFGEFVSVVVKGTEQPLRLGTAHFWKRKSDN